MRVALVQPKFDYSGGAERYGLEVVAGLVCQGHDLTLFARKRVRPPYHANSRRVWALPLGRALKTWSFARSAAITIQHSSYDFDVVYGLGKTYCQSVHRAGGGVHGAYLQRRGRNHLTLNDKVILQIEKRLFSSVTLKAVICPSKWVAREVVRFHPHSKSKIEIIPNGVDTQAFSPKGRRIDRQTLHSKLSVPQNDHIMLFVATNYFLKGLDHAIALLPSLPSVHLVVVGDGSAARYDQQAREIGVRQRVHFLGRQKEMAPFYRGAEVLIHPTRYDPFANVCLEAMACGTPIVTSDHNGIADLLGNALREGVVPLNDMRSRKTIKIIQDRIDDQGRWRRRVRDLSQKYDRRAHCIRIESVFKKITGNADGR